MANMVNIKINGIQQQVEEGTTILKAAEKVGVKIPTLCYHPDLPAWAACGICVVKLAGSPKMMRACATEVNEGMEIITHDPEIVEVRRTVIELILSTHPNDCLQCPRNGTCELQTLAENFGIREVRFEENIAKIPQDTSTPSIILNPEKCVKCGRCVNVCQQLQDVWALEFIGRGDQTRMAPAGDIELNESPCIKCGQCSAHCPVGAIYENDDTAKVWKALRDADRHTVVQIAPAVRVAIGEAFGLDPGTVTTGKVYAALRRLGFDAVFDTNFAADLTIMEEGSEFVERFEKFAAGDVEELPLITSCCPSWVDYMEKYYEDMIPHFSTAKSPQMMMAAMSKTYYPKNVGIQPCDVYHVSVMPCTSKKYEITRSEDMYSSGCQDIDVSITTRELARMIKQAGIDFLNLEDEKADEALGIYTGAGTIFGATGGVMEAALRTAHFLLTDEELGKVEFEGVRGLEGVKEASIDIKGTEIRVAVAHSISNVRTVMERVRDARAAGKEPPYHFIEVMACRGGCIGGGGQPYGGTDEIRNKRIAGMYDDDVKSDFRCSHHNPAIQKLYQDFLGKPLSETSHKYLHTHYTPRPIYVK
jgi:NADH-quinone oxidoreductase subunit G